MMNRTWTARGGLRLALACTILALGSAVGAAVINVPADYATIQEAINAANNGDEVVVAPGCYCECINFGGKAITVRSTDPTNLSVVEATALCKTGGTDPIVRFNSGETNSSQLLGFFITDGWSSPGPAIRCEGASPTIAHNEIADNGDGTGLGGAIYCHQSNAVIEDNTISYGYASKGGGISCISSSPVIRNNDFDSCEAPDGLGGAIYCESSSPTISGNWFYESRVYAGSGGAIYCTGSSSPLISDNRIRGK